MGKHLVGREHVRRWPEDSAAVEALGRFFDNSASADDGFSPTLHGSGKNFSGSDLTGLDLSSAELVGADLSHTNLSGCDLYEAWMQSALLVGADLSHADLRKARLMSAQAEGATLVGAVLTGTDLSDAVLINADLHSTSLFRVFMPGADLRGADLRNCNLGDGTRSTELTGVRLAGAHVSGLHGVLSTAVDVGAHEPHVISGPELQHWFTDRGAPDVTVGELRK